MRTFQVFGTKWLAIFLAAGIFTADASGQNWPSFRGANASGIAEGSPLPVTWNVERGENVKWKTPIAGLGHSSPVVWGDRIFVTTAISGKDDPELRVGLYGNVRSVEDDTVHRWLLYCLDKRSGRILWKRTVFEAVPRVKRHTKASHANSTPAVDGRHVVSFFGSQGIACFDMDGELLWKKDLGPLDSGWYVQPKAQWGFSSSPVIHEQRVLIQCDVQKGSFLAALDVKDGREIWRTPREDVPTWGTPTIYRYDGKLRFVVNGYHHIGGYDFYTGKEVWNIKGGGDIPVPTPVLGHGLIFITNAHGSMRPIYGIRSSASGDVTPSEDEPNEQIAWWRKDRGNYMQTPLVYGDYLYCCNDGGILTCYEARSGKTVYRKRLGKGTGFTASAVAGDGKIYFTSEEGDIHVIKAGPEFEKLAENAMGEICMATPAISDGTLLFRTKGHLVAIGE